jgi:Na+/proline symporter
MTDVLQFIVLTLAVLFVVPLAFAKVGGVTTFIEKAPDGFFALTTDKYTWFFIFGWVMIHFFMVGAEWAFAQRFICVPNEKDAKKSAYLFGVLYLVSPLVWLLPPMLYRVIDKTADPEQAYILACRAVLPVGMVGLMVAAMFSATASMVSSQLNVFAGVLTDGFYLRLFKPQASQKHLMNVGRILTIILGTVLVGVALAIPYLGGAEKLVITTASLMVGPLLAPTIWGLFSRRVNIRAIWVTASISFVLGAIAKLGLAENGWLVTEANGTTVDLTIGVVIPIIVLFVMQHLTRSTADGWNKAERLIQETRNSGVKQKASDMPAVIVGGCLLLLALLMFALIAWNRKDRALLGGFGVAQFLIAGAIFAYLRIKRKRNAAVETEETADSKDPR